MGITRQDMLKRIRYSKRVNYDVGPPSREEMIEPPSRPTRMFRLVKSMTPRSGARPVPGQEKAQAPGLTPTQHALVNEIPQKYNQPRHEVRRFLVNYMASRDPGALVKHLERHFDYPVPEGISFDTTKMGPQVAQEHSKNIEKYISGLQQYLHGQGDKNYDHNIIKAMGDYLDKNQRSEKVLSQMNQYFAKTSR